MASRSVHEMNLEIPDRCDRPAMRASLPMHPPRRRCDLAGQRRRGQLPQSGIRSTNCFADPAGGCDPPSSVFSPKPELAKHGWPLAVHLNNPPSNGIRHRSVQRGATTFPPTPVPSTRRVAHAIPKVNGPSRKRPKSGC